MRGISEKPARRLLVMGAICVAGSRTTLCARAVESGVDVKGSTARRMVSGGAVARWHAKQPRPPLRAARLPGEEPAAGQRWLEVRATSSAVRNLRAGSGSKQRAMVRFHLGARWGGKFCRRRILRLRRTPAGNQLIQNDTERVNIGRGGGLCTFPQLGSHVIGSATERTGLHGALGRSGFLARPKSVITARVVPSISWSE